MLMERRDGMKPELKKRPYDFEEYLQDKHGELHPEVLDDDIPDHYSDWCAELDVDTLIEWANEFAVLKVKQAVDIMKKAIV